MIRYSLSITALALTILAVAQTAAFAGDPAAPSAASQPASAPAVKTQPAAAAPAAPKKVVTVVVFDIVPEAGIEKGAANLLTELVMDNVAKESGAKTIGQKDIEKMLFWEQNKQLKGCTESSCLVKIAGAMGAAYYVEGSIGAVGDRYIITLKLINALTVDVAARSTKVIVKDDNVMVDTVMAMVGEILAPLRGNAPIPDPLVTVSAGAAPSASPQAKPGEKLPKGYHEHDGFYMRMGVGLGLGGGRLGGGSELGSGSLIGLGLQGMLCIGYSVKTNLQVSGDLFITSFLNPKMTVEAYSDTTNSMVSFLAFGPGVSYYFMPSNAFIGGSVGIANESIVSTTVKDGAVTGEAHLGGAGFAMQVYGGREWWVSDNWGLGVMGQWSMTYGPSVSGGKLFANSLAVLFTATYN